ncbi:hypothetical protein BB561_002900 [Smittium simulii]|uniref:Uncharacterized protein n=1 Tax=Smittium simulii TaxID=133385 RepID=A0A2T9YNS9_9FUNG|nr:hypothetical protein BB561_002900 [Smittium simulii]
MESACVNLSQNSKEYNTNNILSNNLSSLDAHIKELSLTSKKASNFNLPPYTNSVGSSLTANLHQLSTGIFSSFEPSRINNNSNNILDPRAQPIFNTDTGYLLPNESIFITSSNRTSHLQKTTALQTAELNLHNSTHYHHQLLDRDLNRYHDPDPKKMSTQTSPESDHTSFMSTDHYNNHRDSNGSNIRQNYKNYHASHASERDLNLTNVDKNEIKLVYLQTANVMSKRAKPRDVDYKSIHSPSLSTKFLGSDTEFSIDKNRSAQKDFTRLTSTSKSSNPKRVFEKEYKINYYPDILHRKYCESAALKKQNPDSELSMDAAEHHFSAQNSPSLTDFPLESTISQKNQPITSQSNILNNSDNIKYIPDQPSNHTNVYTNYLPLNSRANSKNLDSNYLSSNSRVNSKNLDSNSILNFISTNNTKNFNYQENSYPKQNSTFRNINSAIIISENNSEDFYAAKDYAKYRAKSVGTSDILALEKPAKDLPIPPFSLLKYPNVKNNSFKKTPDITNINNLIDEKNISQSSNITSKNVNNPNNNSFILENSQLATTEMKKLKRNGGKITAISQHIENMPTKDLDPNNLNASANDHFLNYIDNNKPLYSNTSSNSQQKSNTTAAPQASIPPQSVYDFLTNSVKMNSTKHKSSDKDITIPDFFTESKNANLKTQPLNLSLDQPQNKKVQEDNKTVTNFSEIKFTDSKYLKNVASQQNFEAKVVNTHQKTSSAFSGLTFNNNENSTNDTKLQNHAKISSKSTSTETQANDFHTFSSTDNTVNSATDSVESKKTISHIPILQYPSDKRLKKKKFRNVRIQCSLFDKFPSEHPQYEDIKSKDKIISELTHQIESTNQTHAEEIGIFADKLNQTMDLNSRLLEELSLTQDLLKKGNNENYDNLSDTTIDYKQKVAETERDLEVHMAVSKNKIDELLEMVAYFSSKCDHYQGLLEKNNIESDLITFKKDSVNYDNKESSNPIEKNNLPYDFYNGAVKLAKGFSSRLSEVVFIENTYKSIADNKKQINSDLEFFGVINRIETEIDDTSTAIESRLKKLTNEIKYFNRKPYGAGALGFESHFQNSNLYYGTQNYSNEKLDILKALKEENRRSTLFNSTPTRSLVKPLDETQTIGQIFGTRSFKSRTSIPKSLFLEPKRHSMAPSIFNSMRLSSNKKADMDILKSITETQPETSNPLNVNQNDLTNQNDVGNVQNNNVNKNNDISCNETTVYTDSLAAPIELEATQIIQLFPDYNEKIVETQTDIELMSDDSKIEDSDSIKSNFALDDIDYKKDNNLITISKAEKTNSSIINSNLETPSHIHKPSPSLSDSSQNTLVAQTKTLEINTSPDTTLDANNFNSDHKILNSSKIIKRPMPLLVPKKNSLDSIDEIFPLDGQTSKEKSMIPLYSSRSTNNADKKKFMNNIGNLSGRINSSNIDSLLEQAIDNLNSSNFNSNKVKENYSRALSVDQLEEHKILSENALVYFKFNQELLEGNNFNQFNQSSPTVLPKLKNDLPRSYSSMGFTRSNNTTPQLKKENTFANNSPNLAQKAQKVSNDHIKNKPSLTGEELLESLKMGVTINISRKQTLTQNKQISHTMLKQKTATQSPVKADTEYLEN